MRYIDVGGEVIPKHCKYGPRPAEGIVFNNYEWWSITDHLVKDQREKELAAVLREKEEAKKKISFNMTRNWTNTLASIKTQSNQKRLEKTEKEKQDKIDQYHQILKSRAEEKRGVLADVRKILLKEKDAIKTISSAVLSCLVMDGRNKQIELKNKLKSEEAKKEEEYFSKIKKDVEDYEREQLEEKIKEQAKLKMYKQCLDKQIAEIKLQRNAEDESAAEEQDLINMRLEGEKIHHCNMVEKNYRRDFAARYLKKTESQLEHERILGLEEEEEEEINKIYNEYNRKFIKERNRREKKMKEEQIERREKVSQLLSQKLEEARATEEQRLLSSLQNAGEEMKKEDEMRKEKERRIIAELLLGKKQAEERRRRERIEEMEREKWEMFQARKTSELNERREAERKRKEDIRREEMMKTLEMQVKEMKKREEEEKREMEAPLEDESAEKEELQNYCQEVLDFVKENNLPDFQVQKTISDIKKDYKIVDTKKESERKREQEGIQKETKQKSRSMGNGCYCLKY